MTWRGQPQLYLPLQYAYVNTVLPEKLIIIRPPRIQQNADNDLRQVTAHRYTTSEDIPLHSSFQ